MAKKVPPPAIAMSPPVIPSRSLLAIGYNADSKYEVLQVIGSGAMGAVYKVRDFLTGQIWALKELAPLYPDAKDKERFEREAKMLANLDHSSLPKVTDYFDDGGKYYLVMDYIEGENLRDYCDKYGSCNEKLVLQWFKTLMDVLKYLHDHNIIFRDIKPDNLILDKAGKLFLVDAGIAIIKPKGAKSVATSGPAAQTDRLGTAPYAAPEQPNEVSELSDIYNAGATFFHILSGKEPLTTQGLPPIPNIATIRPDIDSLFAETIFKMYSYAKADRPQSVAEIQAKMSFNNKNKKLQHLANVEAGDLEAFINPDIGSLTTIAIGKFAIELLPLYQRLINNLQSGLYKEAFDIAIQIDVFLGDCLKRSDQPLFNDTSIPADQKRINEHLKMIGHCRVHLAFEHLKRIPEAEKAARDLSSRELAELAEHLLLAELYEQTDRLELASRAYYAITKMYPSELLAFQKLKEIEDKIEKKKLLNVITTQKKRLLVPAWKTITDKKQWELKSILNLFTVDYEFTMIMASIIFFVTISMAINAYRLHVLDIGFTAYGLVALSFVLFWVGGIGWMKTKDDRWALSLIIAFILSIIILWSSSERISTNCQWGERALVHIAGKAQETPINTIEVAVLIYDKGDLTFDERWKKIKDAKTEAWKKDHPGEKAPTFVSKAVFVEYTASPSPTPIPTPTPETTPQDATPSSSPSVSSTPTNTPTVLETPQPIKKVNEIKSSSPEIKPIKTTDLKKVPKKESKPVETSKPVSTPTPTPTETPSEVPESQIPPYIRQQQ